MMSRLLLLFFIVPAVSFGMGFAFVDPPIVDLGYAQYQGVSNSETGNTEFLGVRYAAPPTGMNCPLARFHSLTTTGKYRWREPRLPGKVDGLQMADTQPNRCQQAPERVDKRNRLQYTTNDVTLADQGSQHVLGDPWRGGNEEDVELMMRPVSEDCLFLKYGPSIIAASSRLG